MTKNIYGYYHIWLVNHWRDVVEEQMEIIDNSGLYDECDTIYISALGEIEEFAELQGMIKDSPKFCIGAYNSDRELYEFQAMDLMKRHADNTDEDYYIFYIHGKGIQFRKEDSEQVFINGTYWRQWSNGHIINRWKDHVKNLDAGYETSGIQYRPHREFMKHYSGNAWWTKSDYVRLLPKVKDLKQEDRFQAEFYIGMANPIAATTSQEFVDYYTPTTKQIEAGIKPRQQKRKKTRNRNIVHTLCWNLYEETERAVESLYELNEEDTFIHYLVDLGFPLVRDNEVPNDLIDAKKFNSEKLKNLAARHGSIYLRLSNIGVSQNWGAVAANVGLGETDILVGCDSDEIVYAKNWVEALGIVLRGDERYGAATLTMPDQLEKFNESNSTERLIEGIRIKEVHGNAMWNVLAISGKLIKSIGGVPYPATHHIYGGLETALIVEMEKRGLVWCALTDYIADHTDNVNLIRQWKDVIIHRRKEFKEQITFEEFLKMRLSGKL